MTGLRCFCLFALINPLLALAAPTSSQLSSPAAADLTVRLFDIDRVRSLVLTPLHAGVTWKHCFRCAAEPLTAPLHLGFQAGPRPALIFDGPNHPQPSSKPFQAAGELQVETQDGHRAVAAGIWHIDPERDGLRVRLTLPSERYVAAVLSAEAPGDEPPASLRALAIVVRSFALVRNAHHEELCDSTRCQAMRLGAISPAIDVAVRETAGETLWFGAARVPAYFTQSSGGASEDAAAAWGGPPKSWLRAHPDPASERAPSQWHTEIAGEDLRDALAAEGFVLHSPVQAIAILRRTASGRAARIELHGAAGERLEISAASFRFAINRTLGWNRLRSDLYTVSVGPGGRAEFDGKGFGHGVGLSQSGARFMAAQGRDERAILGLYFPGTTVRIELADQGWQRREAAGWTLIATSGPQADHLIAAGDAAWRKAVSLLRNANGLPNQTLPHPTLRIFPTTDLFRGVTGEPGWTLGIAHGEQILLQSPQVVWRNSQSADALDRLMLHEMLHVLLEAQTVAAVPLWLREGLVEVLAEQPAGAANNPTLRISTVETHLERPASLAEADRGHREAGMLVARLVATYGLRIVSTWMANGVPPEALSRAGTP